MTAIRVSMAVSTLIWLCAPVYGVDCSIPTTSSTPLSNSIGFEHDSSISSQIVEDAVGNWEEACQLSGISYPDLVVSQAADISVFVHVVSGPSTNASGTCGTATRFLSNNELVSGRITLWTHEADGDPCAGKFVDVLTHEMGHILGLENAGSGCAGRIMGPAIIQNGVRQDRVIDQDDCLEIDDKWVTSPEFEACPECDPDGDGPCAI